MRACAHSEQVEFAGEAERDAGAELKLESSVVHPGHENAAICSFPPEQSICLFKLPVPCSGVINFDSNP
ncbi:hypothetical protein D9M72_604860 [compost metagenome]